MEYFCPHQQLRERATAVGIAADDHIAFVQCLVANKPGWS